MVLPLLRGSSFVVDPEITIAGDVCVGTGDVRVNASLVVGGNVDEGRSVWAKHDLEVAGTAERAEIEAGGSVRVGDGFLHSRLRAGGDRAVFAKLLSTLGAADEDLGNLAIARQLVEEQAAHRGAAVAPDRPCSCCSRAASPTCGPGCARRCAC